MSPRPSPDEHVRRRRRESAAAPVHRTVTEALMRRATAAAPPLRRTPRTPIRGRSRTQSPSQRGTRSSPNLGTRRFVGGPAAVANCEYVLPACAAGVAAIWAATAPTSRVSTSSRSGASFVCEYAPCASRLLAWWSPGRMFASCRARASGSLLSGTRRPSKGGCAGRSSHPFGHSGFRPPAFRPLSLCAFGRMAALRTTIC